MELAGCMSDAAHGGDSGCSCRAAESPGPPIRFASVCYKHTSMRKLLPIALLLTGCVYTNVNTPLSYRAPTPNEVQGQLSDSVVGEACNQAILGLVAWGDGGYAAAVEDAKHRSGARMLADVRADTKLFNVLFVYSKACTRVTGFVVR